MNNLSKLFCQQENFQTFEKNICYPKYSKVLQLLYVFQLLFLYSNSKLLCWFTSKKLIMRSSSDIFNWFNNKKIFIRCNKILYNKPCITIIRWCLLIDWCSFNCIYVKFMLYAQSEGPIKYPLVFCLFFRRFFFANARIHVPFFRIEFGCNLT